MTIGTVKRLAADIMGIGENRVRVKPEGFKEAEKAMTRADVRDLIKKKIVTKVEVKGRRTKVLRTKRGPGGRKGTSKTRTGGKKVWMAKVRAQRAFLFQMIEEGELEKSHKRMLYGRIKSGLFRSKRAFLAYLKDGKMVKQDYEPKSVIPEWLLKKRRAADATAKPVASQVAKPAAVTAAKPVASPAANISVKKEGKQ